MNKYYIYIGIALAILIVGLFVFTAELSKKPEKVGILQSKPASTSSAPSNAILQASAFRGAASRPVFQGAERKLNMLYADVKNLVTRSTDNKAAIVDVRKARAENAKRIDDLEDKVAKMGKDAAGVTSMLNRADLNAKKSIDAIGREQVALREELQRRRIVS
tara:strand:+ start:30 stop:515 length:486 start_codon:yes stop_codon:yes gene_type:complete